MHNSRSSIWMLNHNVKTGIAEYLTIVEEEKLVEIICDHIIKYNLQLTSFNICGDHIHFVILEDSLTLNNVIGRLKSISAREFNIWRGLTKPLNFTESTSEVSKISEKQRGETQNRLWAQKFNRVEISSQNQLKNTNKYITENRIKHQLMPLSNKTILLIESALTTDSIKFY
jgi:REP element-mobilizing transposase RayT